MADVRGTPAGGEPRSALTLEELLEILKGAGLGPYTRDLAFLTAYALLFWGIAWQRLVRRER